MKGGKRGIRSFFSQFRKPVKHSRKLPKAKASPGKGLRAVLWVLLLALVIAAPLAFIRSGNALNSASDTAEELENLQEDGTYKAGSYDPREIEAFGNGVVEEYMTIPAASEKKQEQRETLERYFAEDLPVPTFQQASGTRELHAKALQRIEETEHFVDLAYRVNYTVTGEEEKTKTAMLHVPVRPENGRYTVVDTPYMTALPSLTGSAERVKNPKDGADEVSTSQREAVVAWLKEYFVTYAKGSVKDMQYIMEEPEALGGLQQFDSLTATSVYPGEASDTFVVKTGVWFEDPAIGSRHQEHFTLHLEKQEDRFYVTRLINTLGGM